MSEDLDKMMTKLKTKKVEETSKEDPVEVEDPVDPDEDVDEGEIETPKETPKEDDPSVSIEQEVAILHNTGVFRREMILIARENMAIRKVIAQALIEINKSIGGLINDKKK